MTELAYLTDPLTLEFKASIIHKSSLDRGQVDVILEKTYFYPTGGGQPHDTGWLGDGQVIDVFKAENGQVVHRLDRDVAGSVVSARVDGERRLGHMQHHSAQHILSRVLEQVLDLDTLSVKISTVTPATVDVPDAAIRWSELAQVERQANQIVFENRAVKSYFITAAQIKTVPFRRPPTVTGQIRVVEVDSFDYSACGGTHCPQTGMIGLIKILKTERKNRKLRLHFVAGHQALMTFQQYHRLAAEICQQMSAGLDDVVELVHQQAEQLQAAQLEIKSLRIEMLTFEVERLMAQAESIEGIGLVTKLYQNQSVSDLRELGKRLQAQDKLVALLAGYDGNKLALVVSCADGTGLNAKELLVKHLAQIGGKGGGDARLAQGGGEATPWQVEQLFAQTRTYVQ